MKFLLTSTSGKLKETEIDVDTIDDLLRLHRTYGHLIILSNHDCPHCGKHLADNPKGPDYQIEVYDDYRE